MILPEGPLPACLPRSLGTRCPFPVQVQPLPFSQNVRMCWCSFSLSPANEQPLIFHDSVCTRQREQVSLCSWSSRLLNN